MTNANALRKRLERIRRELKEISEEFLALDWKKSDATLVMASAHVQGAISDITLAIGQRS